MKQACLRNSVWGLTMVLAAAAAPPVHAEDQTPASRIAEAHGFSHWDQVAHLRFTFNVNLGDRSIVRHWDWDVKTTRVTLRRGADGEPITFNHDAIGPDSPEAFVKAHHQFINDTYWLLFPFQLVWSNPQVVDEGMAAFPIPDVQRRAQGRKVVVTFPSEGGYTPGDAYELYLNPDELIEQWVFRRGGGENGRPATFEDHCSLGPIILSTLHRGPEGSGFKLWFTDVSATLADGRDVTPQTLESE